MKVYLRSCWLACLCFGLLTISVDSFAQQKSQSSSQAQEIKASKVTKQAKNQNAKDEKRVIRYATKQQMTDFEKRVMNSDLSDDMKRAVIFFNERGGVENAAAGRLSSKRMIEIKEAMAQFED